MTDEENDAYQVLKELGLSKLTITCYQSLSVDGHATVGTLARRLYKLPTGLHRNLNKLEALGFIKSYHMEGYAHFYAAEPAYVALANYQAQQRVNFNALIWLQQQRFYAPKH